MEDQAKQEAATHARRAGSQARNAARNGARAVEDLAEPVIEVAEEKAENAVSFAKNFLPTKREFVALGLAAVGGALIYDGVKSFKARKIVTSVPPVTPPV